MRENYYKCCVNSDQYNKLNNIVLVDSSFKNDNIVCPVGNFDEHSSLTHFFFNKKSNNGGYSYEKFFDILKKYLDEKEKVLDFRLEENVLRVVTQRFSDRFYRNVETFDIIFNAEIRDSIFYNSKFQSKLSSLIVLYGMRKIYSTSGKSLTENNYKKRAMYKQYFLLFDAYCRDKDYNFDNFFVSPEEFIEFCEENAYLLISDYYEFYKEKIFNAHSGDGTISYYDSENDISSGKFGSKVLSVYSKNPSLAKNILKVGGAVGKVFGCKYLYDIKVIQAFEDKFVKMISDIKAKYFVMGYEDEKNLNL